MKHQVLKMLREDARLSAAQIANRLGVDAGSVAAAIAELEKERAILAYKAVANPEAAGEDIVEAVIEVHVAPKRGEGFDGIARRIGNFPEVHSLYLMSGGSDFLLFMEARSLKEIARFVTEKLSTMEDVKETQTHFLLKKYKESGVSLEAAGEGPERLVVSP